MTTHFISKKADAYLSGKRARYFYKGFPRHAFRMMIIVAQSLALRCSVRHSGER